MGTALNILDRKFERLTVVSFSHLDNLKQRVHNCKCDCGNTMQVIARSLMSGNTKSCGCLQRERTSGAAATHGKCGVPEYHIWCDIKRRCYKPKDKAYKNYGGRGIKMCEEWLNNFSAFYTHIGQRPFKDATIDRINNDGNYEPGNCRWATRDVQQNNKRTNRLLTFNGQTRTCRQWAGMIGIKYGILRGRLYRGWSDERILTQTIRKSINA